MTSDQNHAHCFKLLACLAECCNFWLWARLVPRNHQQRAMPDPGGRSAMAGPAVIDTSREASKKPSRDLAVGEVVRWVELRKTRVNFCVIFFCAWRLLCCVDGPLLQQGSAVVCADWAELFRVGHGFL